MKAGRTNRRLLVAVIATLIHPATLSLAEVTAPINRLGRVWGAGWGDGYHACHSSGIRLGADLPPRSYSQRKTHAVSHRTHGLHGGNANYYDSFDAAGGPPQNRSHSRYDGLPGDTSRIIIEGSHVIQSPHDAPQPLPAGPVEIMPAPPADVGPEPTPGSGRAMRVPQAPSSHTGRAVNGGAVNGRAVKVNPSAASRTPLAIKPRPIRPTEPLVRPRFVAPARSVNASVTTTRINQLGRPGKLEQAETQALELSRTPNTFVLRHPGNRFGDRTQRLLRAALGDLVTVRDVLRRANDPFVGDLAAVDPTPRSVSASGRASTGMKAFSLHGILDRFDSITASDNAPSVARSQPSRSPAAIQIRPLRPGQMPGVKIDRTTRLGATRRLGVGATGVRATRRLGTNTEVTSGGLAARVESTSAVQHNPLVLPRAVLELAKRSPTPGSPLIRQPN